MIGIEIIFSFFLCEVVIRIVVLNMKFFVGRLISLSVLYGY